MWSSPIKASTPPCFDVPGEIGVAEHVAGAVDARALAVPEAENAVEAALAAHLGLLRAPDRGRRQLLVEARLKWMSLASRRLLARMKLMIEAAERRAAIAGDEPAVFSPARRSSAFCISSSRAIACAPERKTRRLARSYLSARDTLEIEPGCAVERAFHHVRHRFLSCRRNRRLSAAQPPRSRPGARPTSPQSL